MKTNDGNPFESESIFWILYGEQLRPNAHVCVHVSVKATHRPFSDQLQRLFFRILFGANAQEQI